MFSERFNASNGQSKPFDYFSWCSGVYLLLEYTKISIFHTAEKVLNGHETEICFLPTCKKLEIQEGRGPNHLVCEITIQILEMWWYGFRMRHIVFQAPLSTCVRCDILLGFTIKCQALLSRDKCSLNIINLSHYEKQINNYIKSIINVSIVPSPI